MAKAQNLTSNGTIGRRPKHRDLEEDLRIRKWKILRVRGDHAIWGSPCGTRIFPLVAGHRNREATQAVLLTYRRSVIGAT